MATVKDFFELIFGGLEEYYVQIREGGIYPEHTRHEIISEFLSNIPEYFASPAFFGLAARKAPGLDKGYVAVSNVVWIDYDESKPQETWLLPPTMIVSSGNGYHVYWKLTAPCADMDKLERANKLMAQANNGDHTYDCTRILRIPGTANTKEAKNPKPVELILFEPEHVYDLDLILTFEKLSEKTLRKIVTGDARGYKSRSERDWAIVAELVKVFESEVIEALFEYNACGDKYRESGEHYLTTTIEKATKEKSPSVSSEIFETEDGFYRKAGNKNAYRLSTFVINPKQILAGLDEDFILADVRASGIADMWENIAFPKSAFNSTASLQKSLPRTSWIWLGKDADCRELLLYLTLKLQELGYPCSNAVPCLGKHGDYLVTNTGALDSYGVIKTGTEAPYTFIDRGREIPQIVLSTEPPNVELLNILPKINKPEVIWPMIGWYFAAFHKPVLEEIDYRFPVLNLFGTRGSGKSSTVLKAFQPLMGYDRERTYDANTTRFVILTLLGSMNNIPVAFSEFRSSNIQGFIRYVLLSYDMGHDPRGNADQSTTDYPLLAPFSIDGEDQIDDPAAMERSIPVHFAPGYIAEGTEAHTMFNLLMNNQWGGLPYAIYREQLRLDVKPLLQKARNAMQTAFAFTLPNRVRNNYAVVYMGMLIYQHIAQILLDKPVSIPEPDILQNSMECVYNPKMGRAPMANDKFIEFVVNAAVRNSTSFLWEVTEGHFYFQLAPAYSYYAMQMARQRMEILSLNAIRGQIDELLGEYMLPPEARNIDGKVVLTYGVDLERASQVLDVPSEIKGSKLILNLG